MNKPHQVLRTWSILLLLLLIAPGVSARNEAFTVPVIMADYYAFSYYQGFKDHAHIYAFTTAGVDALGWGIVLGCNKYSGLSLVNIAGVSKTVYPLVRLMESELPNDVRRRAWTSVGTHAGTLLFLKFMSKPAIVVHSWAPSSDGTGLRLTYRF